MVASVIECQKKVSGIITTLTECAGLVDGFCIFSLGTNWVLRNGQSERGGSSSNCQCWSICSYRSQFTKHLLIIQNVWWLVLSATVFSEWWAAFWTLCTQGKWALYFSGSMGCLICLLLSAKWLVCSVKRLFQGLKSQETGEEEALPKHWLPAGALYSSGF